MVPDTSQTYLLFQTLLLLFWIHSCMIWTKLTRTDAVFSRDASVVLYCAGFWIFRCAGKISKNQIKNQRSGRFQEAKGGPQGSQGAPRRLCGAAPLWPRHRGLWVGPTPPGALPWPYLFPRRGNSRTEVVFSIYIAEPPPPSALPRES